MNHRRHLAALAVSALALAWPLAGCSDDGPGDASGTGGSSAQTGTGGSSQPTGGAGMGGSSQPTGGTGMGGSSQPTGGTGGGATGGQSGTSGSGGGPTASCDNVVACGGDVVGTWTVAASCLGVSGEVDMAGFGLGCPTAPVSGSLQVSGAWTFNADGTFSDNTTTSGSEQLDLPASCLNVSGTTTTCDRVGGPVQALGYSSVTCANAASGGGCTCPATVQQTGGMGIVSFSASGSGNYTSASNVITITGNDFKYSYCVSGTTLTMTPQGASAQTGTLTGTVVLQKQ